MTLVNITLTPEEQDFLLALGGLADKTIYPVLTREIAAKVRRAQEDIWTDDLYAAPDITPCGLCGASRAVHDEPDHDWQWFRKPGSGDPVKFPGPGAG